MKTVSNITPVVGMGATQQVGSDCYPYTIVKVISDKRIVVQADNAVPDHDNGYNYYSNQVWIFTPNTDAKEITLSLRKNGKWLPIGSSISNGGCYASGFGIGNRYKHQNPSY